MENIKIINIDGKLHKDNFLYNTITTWIGKLVSIGQNIFAVIEGDDIITLIDMPDMTGTFDRENSHKVVSTPTRTLFLFDKDGGIVINGKDVICITSDTITYHRDAVMEIKIIKNIMLGDYEPKEPVKSTTVEKKVMEYFLKK